MSDVNNKTIPERRLLAYFSPYKWLFLGGLLCTTVVSAISAYFIKLINDVVGSIIHKDLGQLDKVALMIIGIHVVKGIFSFGQTYFVSAATNKIAIRIRNELFSHLQRLSLGFYERSKLGHLMSRMTNDVGLIQSSGPQVVKSVQAPLIIVFTLVYIFRWNWKLALISVVCLPLMSYTMQKIGRGMRGLTEMLQLRLADVAAVVQETLSAIRVVKSFGMEDYEIERFAEENRRTYKSAMRAVSRNATMSPILELIGVSSISFVLWYGGRMVARNAFPNFHAESLIAFLFALNQIASSARDVGGINITYNQTMAGAKRIFDVLDEEPEVRDKPGVKTLDTVMGRIEFNNVSFAYSRSRNVIEGISFTVEPGQQIALVGPSGAGKSTIANLIPRFYEVSEGAVLVDDMDIRDVTVKSLRNHIGIVPQETMLFSSSIRENIAYGRIDASEEEIIDAARAANAHAFIERLPEGYDTLVGERGTRLSGGERQRVAIARALLKNPRILILDEATSSLDVASEAVVQEALERLMRDRTTIVIAHRLSTIVNADKILVMRHGRIVESGTHGELMSLGGLYAELYSVQSKGRLPRTDVVGGSV
jgi:subfamily B ATP-binding cassette protein MsbA